MTEKLTTEQAGKAWSRVMGLFPGWKPTDDEAAEWLGWLGDHDDAEAVEKAISQHYREMRFSRPNIKGVSEQLRTIQGNRSSIGVYGSDGKDADGRTGYMGVSVICTEGKRAGWTIPLYTGKRLDMPPMTVCQQRAGIEAEKHADVYGGKFMPFTGTEEEALTQGRRIRTAERAKT